MPAGAASLEKALDTTMEELHEYLWGSGYSGAAATLESRLANLTTQLDAALGAKGGLVKAAGPLVKPLRKEGHGGSQYYTLVWTLAELALARAAYLQKDYEKCARLSFNAITNLTIGMLGGAGRFDVVAEYEHKSADPKVYMEKAVDALAGAGAKTADRWMRLYLLAHAAKETVPQLGDGPSKRLGANAALALAGVAAVRFNGICREIGGLNEAVFGRFPEFAASAALGRK
jgi:hypothetical protein